MRCCINKTVSISSDPFELLVGPAPALALAVADVPGHELDDVLARVAQRLADLVEDLAAPAQA